MADLATTLIQLVLLLAWTCLDTTVDKQKHPIYAKVFSSRVILEQLLTSSSLTFAPGLLDALQAATPPTVAYFKSLPTHCKKQWAVYLLVLEKPKSRPSIYIGSGTALRGAQVRLAQYDTRDELPTRVFGALKDGYTIVHKGILCSMPIPSAALMPVTRTLMILLEATFTFAFWAMYAKTDYAYGMAHMCSWSLESLEYDGLCTHSALYERVLGDFNLTAEELEAQAAELTSRKKEYTRNHMAAVRERVRALDLEAWRAEMREQRSKYLKNNPGAQKEATQRAKDKAVRDKKHYCATCNHSFNRKVKLDKHLKGPKHARAVKRANGEKVAKPVRNQYC